MLSIFFFGFLFFSSLSSVVFFDVLKFGLYIPEPLILALYLLVLKNSRISLSLKELALVFLFITVFLIVLLLSINDVAIKDAYASGRCYLIIALSAVIANRIRYVNINYIYYFLFGIVMGDILKSRYSAYANMDFQGISAMNIVAMYLFCAISVIIKNRFSKITAVVIAILAIFFSGFRVIMLAAFLGIYVAPLLNGIKDNIAHRMFLFIKTTLFFLLSGWVVYSFASYLPSEFEYSVYRVIDRTADALVFINDSNINTESRYDMIIGVEKVYNHIKLLPSGFIMTGYDFVGFFNDAPYLNVFVSLGYGLGFFLLVMLSLIYVASFLKFLAKGGNGMDAVIVTSSILQVILMCLNGRFLYIPYEACLFGFLLGLNISYIYKKDANWCDDKVQID